MSVTVVFRTALKNDMMTDKTTKLRENVGNLHPQRASYKNMADIHNYRFFLSVFLRIDRTIISALSHGTWSGHNKYGTCNRFSARFARAV